MLVHYKDFFSFIAGLLVYTMLIVFSVIFTLSAHYSLGTRLLVTSVLVLAFFLIAVLLLRARYTAAKHEMQEMKNELKKTTSELDETKKNLENKIEKRTFEIAVINASLNREIAERMQAEAESRKLQKRMELILNSAGEGIFGLDTNGDVTFVNTAALVMLGWQRDELLGKSHHELVHHSHGNGTPHDLANCLIMQAYQDGIVHFSSNDVFWTKEGMCFPVEYVSTPIVDNSTIQGAVVVFRDTSTFE